MKHLYDFSLNKNAERLLKEKVIPYAEDLRIGISKLNNGATVLDMGIDYPGGWLAGKYFVEACLGGMGQLSFGKMKINNYFVPTVRIKATYPAISEMAAHSANWKIPYDNGLVCISGPVRAIKGADIFARAVDYRDSSADVAVACIQTTNFPDEELTGSIAKYVGINPDKLYIIAARTGTIVGSIQVSARNIEQSLPAIFDRGFPMSAVIQANAAAPVISIVDDEETAYGRVNDCLIYGQETNIYVRCEDKQIIDILDDLPFSKNKDVYGIEFKKLFAECGNDWANVPRDWDAPCKVNFYNLSTGNIFSTGKIGYNVLERAFLGE